MSNTIDNLKLRAGWAAQKIAQNQYVQKEINSFTNLLNSTTHSHRRRVPPVGDLEKRSNLEARNQVASYLYAQNFLTQPYPDAQNLATALRKVQQEARLPETGVYDYATAKYIEQPRCNWTPAPGQPATISLSLTDNTSGGYAFVATRFKWEKRHLFYQLRNTSTKLAPAESYSAIRKAFQEWSHVSTLTFTEVPLDGTNRGYQSADIEMGFYTGAHGEANERDWFSGPGAVLAHSEVPKFDQSRINIHFDDDEPWNPLFLLWVAVHEIGHALGLSHSLEPSAVMYPTYSDSVRQLGRDDVLGIQSLYGAQSSPWENINLAADVGLLSGIGAISHDSDDIDLFYTDPNGAVMCTGTEPNGTWETHQVSAPGTSAGRAITCLSMGANHIETFWIGTSGSIMGLKWKRVNGVNQSTTYVLAPAGSVSEESGLAAVRRSGTTMDVFWISPNGALCQGHWDLVSDTWSTATISDANWAVTGELTAVSRQFNSMQVFFIGPDGDVKEFAWSYVGEETAHWSWYQVAPPGSARTIFSGITAVVPRDGHLEVLWHRMQGLGIDNAYWEANVGWKMHKVWVNFDQRAFRGITSFRRHDNYYEVWWSTHNGSTNGIYWHDEAPNEPPALDHVRKYRYNIGCKDDTTMHGAKLTALVRSDYKVDMFARGLTGNIVQFAFRL